MTSSLRILLIVALSWVPLGFGECSRIRHQNTTDAALQYLLLLANNSEPLTIDLILSPDLGGGQNKPLKMRLHPAVRNEGVSLVVCDDVVVLFEYGKRTYSRWREWQLPYWVDQSGACVLIVTSKGSDSSFAPKIVAGLHVIALISKNTIINSKFEQELKDDSGSVLPDYSSILLGYMNNNESSHFPTVLMLDSDTLVTNKSHTIADFKRRIHNAFDQTPLISTHTILEEDSSLSQYHFVVGIDALCSLVEFPVNAGVFLFRPSQTVAMFLWTVILLIHEQSHFGDQATISFILNRLGASWNDLHLSCTSTSSLWSHLSRDPHHAILKVRMDDMRQFGTHIYDGPLRTAFDAAVDFFHTDSPLGPRAESDIGFAMVVPCGWFNSRGCQLLGYASSDVVGISALCEWKPGDWIVHFYGCANSYKTIAGRKTRTRMSEHPENIGAPQNVNWTEFALNGIPVA